MGDFNVVFFFLGCGEQGESRGEANQGFFFLLLLPLRGVFRARVLSLLPHRRFPLSCFVSC